MIFYSGEDPATGSAAGCAASWMVRYGIAASEERVVIRQGAEIHRPSEIYVRARREGELCCKPSVPRTDCPPLSAGMFQQEVS